MKKVISLVMANVPCHPHFCGTAWHCCAPGMQSHLGGRYYVYIVG